MRQVLIEQCRDGAVSYTRGVNLGNVKVSLPHLLQLLQVLIKTLNAPTVL
ncbi:hypothetical protein HanIR_Chr02g0092291 [Helianthus annuus]|nr:hypothetical protein HanIR_Chr02g0092291 [Helianthus annuus]